MFKKSDILNSGGYNKNTRYAQDKELWKRLMINGYKFSAINEILYDWRLNTNSISLNKHKEQSFSNKNIDFPIYHHLQNLYFRDQNRRKILNNSIKLYKAKELSHKDISKLIIALQPINYKNFFKYF